MTLKKSQSLLLSALIICALGSTTWLPSARAISSDPLPTAEENNNHNQNTERGQFEHETDAFAGDQARLGGELAQLPGPNVDFNGLLRVVITWSVSLAASVAIFRFVTGAFTAISGTEEARNRFKRLPVQLLIGLGLIYFSYQLVAWVVGLIWA